VDRSTRQWRGGSHSNWSSDNKVNERVSDHCAYPEMECFCDGMGYVRASAHGWV